MSNDYFQFKKFRIEQSKSAMKVCTDACILGAFTNPGKAKRILDIGTGTGLLSLMLAQKSPAMIDAVEIEQNAFEQARENIFESSWKAQITVHHTSIQAFFKDHASYDLIISNPPFFKNQLKSPTLSKNIALHNEALSFEELMQAVARLLKQDGKFYVLLPAYESELLIKEGLPYQLHLNKKLNIKDRKKSALLRIISIFSFTESPIEELELIIKNEQGEYTEDFVKLLKEYYLHL